MPVELPILLPKEDAVSQCPRSRSPQETLTAIAPWLKSAGVSRLADITGMDCIGIPVFASVRPDSKSLSVDSGKGITPLHAKASAAMEALERWALDEVPVQAATGSNPDLRFPQIRGAIPSTPRSWVNSVDVVSGENVSVPYYCVKLYDDSATLQERVWAASTNGMASGNTRDEAIASGIFEVIERDAIHMANLNGTIRRADVEGEFPFVKESIGKIRAAGAELFAYDCTSDVGIPVFLAVIADKEKGVGMYKGYGCHLCPEIALNRAICEAAQARCVIMSGCRDDVIWSHHQRVLSDTHNRDWATELKQEAFSTRLQDMSDLSTESVDGDIDKAVTMLSSAGFERVLVVDFPIEGAPFSCVKVLIPKMAGYFYLHGVEYGRLDGRPQ